MNDKHEESNDEPVIPYGDIKDAVEPEFRTYEHFLTCYRCKEKSQVGEIFPDEDDRFLCSKCYFEYVKIPKQVRFPKNKTHQYFKSVTLDSR